MRAAAYRRTGPAAEVLELIELPDPEPGPGEVLVAVRASGVNPADTKRRAGWRGAAMAHPLIVPHSDGAGEIIAAGPGVDAGRVGSRVWLWKAQGGYDGPGRAFGTAAARIALPAELARPLPAALGFDAGACLGVPFMTAWRAVMGDGPVAGQTILVQGGGGAVGNLAVQIAVSGGARVIATAGSPDTAAIARAAGAAAVVDRHGDVVAAVMALTGGAGVERVVEVDFAANHAADARMLKADGTLASYSSTSDPTPPLAYYDLGYKGLTVRFVQGGRLPGGMQDEAESWLARHAAGLRLPIGARFPLAAIAAAHARVEAGAAGQTVVLV